MSVISFDPRTLDDTDFDLRGGALTDTDSVPLRARLLENRRDGALVELRVLGESQGNLMALEPGSHYLALRRGSIALRTLGGRVVLPGMPAWRERRAVQLEVVDPIGSWSESFDDLRLRSPEHLADYDGTSQR